MKNSRGAVRTLNRPWDERHSLISDLQGEESVTSRQALIGVGYTKVSSFQPCRAGLAATLIFLVSFSQRQPPFPPPEVFSALRSPFLHPPPTNPSNPPIHSITPPTSQCLPARESKTQKKRRCSKPCPATRAMRKKSESYLDVIVTLPLSLLSYSPAPPALSTDRPALPRSQLSRGVFLRLRSLSWRRKYSACPGPSAHCLLIICCHLLLWISSWLTRLLDTKTLTLPMSTQKTSPKTMKEPKVINRPLLSLLTSRSHLHHSPTCLRSKTKQNAVPTTNKQQPPLPRRRSAKPRPPPRKK